VAQQEVASTYEKATQTTQQLIEGMERFASKFLSISKWEIHYSHKKVFHASPRFFRPPDHPIEQNVVNAMSDGDMLAILGTKNRDDNDVYLYKDGLSVEYDEGTYSYAIIPDFSVQLVSHFRYTDMVFIDIYQGKEIKEPLLAEILNTPHPSEAKFFTLPRQVILDKSEYRIRNTIESVDGWPCHVLERPGLDIIWLDVEHGYIARRRESYQKPGMLEYIVQNKDLQEYSDGLWLPRTQTCELYCSAIHPEVAGKLSQIQTNIVEKMMFGDSVSKSFVAPYPKPGTLVSDIVRGVSYKVLDSRIDLFKQSVDQYKADHVSRHRLSRLDQLCTGVIATNLIALAWMVASRMRRQTGSDPL